MRACPARQAPQCAESGLAEGSLLDAAAALKHPPPVAERDPLHQGLIVQRANLKARDYQIDLASKLNKTQVVSVAMPLSQQAGYYCSVCDCVLRDSLSYLDHINGKWHNRALGMSMNVEQSTAEQVRARLAEAKKAKDKGGPAEAYAPDGESGAWRRTVWGGGRGAGRTPYRVFIAQGRRGRKVADSLCLCPLRVRLQGLRRRRRRPRRRRSRSGGGGGAAQTRSLRRRRWIRRWPQ